MKIYRKIIMYVLFTLVGIGLFLWAIHRAHMSSWHELWQNAKQLHSSWILLSVSLAFCTYFPKALRWKLLLQASQTPIRTGQAYNIMMVGYLVNIALPRAGDLSRSLLLKRATGAPIAQTLGTTITERLLDLLCLFLLVLLTLSIEGAQLLPLLHNFGLFPQQHWLYLLGYAIAGGVIGALLYAWSRKKHLSPLHLHTEAFLKKIFKSIYSIKNIQQPFSFALYTLLIWSLYYLSMYTLLHASTQTAHLDPFAALSVLSVSGIAASIPTPGAFGSYHLLVSAAIEAYHIPKDISFVLSTTIHLGIIFLTAIAGMCALKYAITKNEKTPKHML